MTIIALTSDQSVDAQLHTTGPAGATFTPHVDENGVLSWTNNRGLENPGSLDLKRLQSEEVSSAIVSTAEALQTAYANIFKGRNLLEGTNQGATGWRYIVNVPVDSVSTLDAHDEGVKLSLLTPPSQYGVLTFNLSKTLAKLQPNTNYILSFDLTCNTTGMLRCMLARTSGVGALTPLIYVYPKGNEEVEHIQVSLMTNDLTETMDSQGVYFNMPREAGKYWIIKNLKLERGSTSTPWVPAPEDAIAGIPGLTEKTASAFDAAEEFALSNLPVNGGLAPARVSTVTLRAANWIGSASPYSQVVSIAGTTENSKVDLTPTVEQMAIFHHKDLAFVTENDDGVITVYAIGDKPTNDYTMPVTITEVTI